MALVCDICKIRPAQARINFFRDGKTRVVDVCGYDYAKLQANPAYQGFLPNEEFVSSAMAEEKDRMNLADILSESAQECLQEAAQTAVEFGSSKIENAHLLSSLTKNELIQHILTQFKIKPTDVQGYLEANMTRLAADNQMPSPSLELQEVLGVALTVSEELGHSYLGPEHLLIALLQADQGSAGTLLRKYGLTPESLRQQTIKLVGDGAEEGVSDPSATPQLDKYSRDLTALAEQQKLDPVIGRASEIETAIEVLARRTKNNPVLIGEPGVGKTAIVEGLAQRIAEGTVPDVLKDKRLLEISLTSLIAGTRYRGEFEERIQALLEEVRNNQDSLLLFVDELHTVVGSGGNEGGLDAANVLKPALARGELHLIGATTLNEYQKHIEKDSALERRFQPVVVKEPAPKDAIAIIKGLRGRYEVHHAVKITDAAITAAVQLSDRYITNRFLPDKAIDLVDQASARAHIRKQKEVTEKDIAAVVAKLTGVPVTEVTQEERQKLLKLEEHLHKRVVGQDEAVRAVANAIRLSRAGLSPKHTPIATFLFLGPTGVGKTELAKALAESMFDSEDSLVRIDMSEYRERHAIARLIGSPPGYVGYDEGGQLTEAIRRHPYSVILLDEIEKAHPDVYNLLLQVLDDGRLTDGKGRVVDFSNTVIIATSNLGTGFVKNEAIGFALSTQEETVEKEHFTEALRKHFRPEFVNRLDEIIAFHPLTKQHIGKIVGLQLQKVKERLAAQKVAVTFDKSVNAHLAVAGFKTEFGARELRRKIKTEVENIIAKHVLEGSLKPGGKIRVKHSKEKGMAIEVA